MSEIEFLRIEQRAGNLVAVFDWGISLTGHNGTFCLDEKNLRARIANVERDGRDSAVEHAALAELVRLRTSTRATEREG